MTRLLTVLVLLVDAGAAGLLLFQGLGWLDVHPLEVRAAFLLTAAGAGAAVLVGAALGDFLDRSRRALGAAFALTGLWLLGAPALGRGEPAAAWRALAAGLLEDPLLVVALYLVLLGYLALRRGEPVLGPALALGAPLLVLVHTRLLGGPSYPALYRVGLTGSAAALLLLLTLRERRVPLSWAWSAFLAACGAYGLVR